MTKTQSVEEVAFLQMIETQDKLIECQREEQEMVLKRQTVGLPILCSKINTLAQELEQQQMRLQSSLSPAPLSPHLEAYRHKCIERFTTLQELTQQNDLLLENSLYFLQELLQQILGVRHPPSLYNEMGIMPAQISEAGVLLNKKV